MSNAIHKSFTGHTILPLSMYSITHTHTHNYVKVYVYIYKVDHSYAHRMDSLKYLEQRSNEYQSHLANRNKLEKVPSTDQDYPRDSQTVQAQDTKSNLKSHIITR